MCVTPVETEGAHSRATADYIQANARQLDGKRTSIQIARVEPGRLEGDVQWFTAWTYSDEGWGGSIPVIVPADRADSFLRKFGTQTEWVGLSDRVKTKRLDATVRPTKAGHVVLDTRDRFRPAPSPVIRPQYAATIRTWTAADGRTLEAEYLGHDAQTVTLRRAADSRTFTVPRADLSAADNAWLDAQQP
ncbi:MAG: hypothetical protein D6781_12135 [Verrucomicrobia bacterium]|nr:MAG: hypothetical protein D6781_12135 [Verrucomicrobiota bacterium]